MTTVQQVLVRLNTDLSFRHNFRTDETTALQEYPLSPDEIAVLGRLDLAQWTTIKDPISTPDGRGGLRTVGGG